MCGGGMKKEEADLGVVSVHVGRGGGRGVDKGRG